MWWPQLEFGSCEQRVWYRFSQMANEFLMRRPGEHSLFPEARGQATAVALGDGIKCDLCKVAQAGSAASG